MLASKNHNRKPVYITGDFNLNLLDYNTNRKVKSYLNIIFSHSFPTVVPLINKPTRISRRNATVIDHVLTNAFMNENYFTGIVKTDLSDHFPVFFITETELNKTSKVDFIFSRKITDINLKKFKDALMGVDWNNVLKHTDPDSAYNEFLKTFLFHYEVHFPIRKIQIKSKNLTSPWITKGIVKSSKRKQKLYEKFLKRKTSRK